MEGSYLWQLSIIALELVFFAKLTLYANQPGALAKMDVKLNIAVQLIND